MNPDNSAFENLAFNPVNLETVLLSEVVDPEEKLFKESPAELDIKYFFLETLPDFFQNTTDKDFSILHLNIRSLQRHFDGFKSFLSHLNFTFKLICLSETKLRDVKHAVNFNLSNYQMINLYRQNGRAGGGVKTLKVLYRKVFLTMTVKHFLSELLTKQKISFLVQFIGHRILVYNNSKTR